MILNDYIFGEEFQFVNHFFKGFGTNTSASAGLFGGSQQTSTLFGNPGASAGNFLKHDFICSCLFDLHVYVYIQQRRNV